MQASDETIGCTHCEEVEGGCGIVQCKTGVLMCEQCGDPVEKPFTEKNMVDVLFPISPLGPMTENPSPGLNYVMGVIGLLLFSAGSLVATEIANMALSPAPAEMPISAVGILSAIPLIFISIGVWILLCQIRTGIVASSYNRIQMNSGSHSSG